MTNFSNRDALILINTVEGLGIKRKHRLLSYGEPKDILSNIDECFLDIVGIIGREQTEKLKAQLENDTLDIEKDKLYKAGVDVVCPYDDEYPKSLLDIYEYPTLLYLKGNKSLLNTRAISVVGTRNASRYGINVTRDFVTEFVRGGLTVVSGFARGIDSTAHKACLDADGNTIACVASGLDICYPAENNALMDKILESNSLFVSEYRLGTFPAQFNFPERNRIISGLADALFVPEMRIKSGTMITVNHALEQGKEIFVVPANINSPSGEGSNLIIKQMQGSIVLSPEDVLENMHININKKQKEEVQLSLPESQILEVLEKSEAHFEELITATSLTANELQTVLFDMEMNDLIERTSGNYYTLK